MRGSEIDIVQERVENSYRIKKDREIVSYKREPLDHIVHGLQCKEEKKKESRAV